MDDIDFSKPFKLYHGTPNHNFSSFKPYSYFTADKDYAKRYAKGSGANPSVITVEMNMKKPFQYGDPKSKKIFEQYVRGGNALGISPDTDLSQMKNIDWTEANNLIDYLKENHPNDYDGLILDEGGDFVDSKGNMVAMENPDRVGTKSRGRSYLNFNPEQVKILETEPAFDNEEREVLKRWYGLDK